MSPFARALDARQFVVTAEVAPPFAVAPERLLERAAPLRGAVQAVNVTDGAGGRAQLSALAAAALLARDGFEPILQLTCRDRNRIALQSELLGAAALGLRNLLVLRGDEPDPGERSKGVFELDSRALLEMAHGMRDGALAGRALDAPVAFTLGCAETPIDPPAGWRPDALRAKAEAGARFVQTQFCFDAGLARRWVAALADAGLTERLAVLIGLGPIASAKSARWMRDQLFGTVMPDAVIARLEGAADPRAEGIALCAELVRELRGAPGVAGVHLMAPGNLDAVAETVRRAG